MNIFKKTLLNLKNTKSKIRDTFKKIKFNKSLTNEDIENIENCLLGSDVGWELTEKIISQLESAKDGDNWENVLIKSIKSNLSKTEIKKVEFKQVVIVIGINGTGKTTASAKLAQFFKNDNKNLTLVAADTFRAAAVDQLKIWAERLNVNFISNYNSSDPASIAYDGTNSGIKNNHDHIIIDTAGRLHTSANLMHELEKIYRIVSRLTTQITVLMSIDANIGQNSIKQVEEFNKYLPIDSIIINKMDGTAKGGIVLSILQSLKIPISFLGVGESYSDIIPFNLDNYLNSMVKGN